MLPIWAGNPSSVPWIPFTAVKCVRNIRCLTCYKHRWITFPYAVIQPGNPGLYMLLENVGLRIWALILTRVIVVKICISVITVAETDIVLLVRDIIPQEVYDRIFRKDWVIYAKKPFKTPETVIEYLGRYTHKVAISNHRIKELTSTHVSFSLKNYRKEGKKQLLTLSHREFIRRFSLHILPKGFTRIRHYGILSSTWKKRHLKSLQKQLDNKKRKRRGSSKRKKPSLHRKCPICKKGNLTTIKAFKSGRPPPGLSTFLQQFNFQNLLNRDF